MTVIADGTKQDGIMGDRREAQEALYGLFRVLETMRTLSPPDLVQRRCQKCHKLLCRAERQACLEIKCPRCGHMATFP